MTRTPDSRPAQNPRPGRRRRAAVLGVSTLALGLAGAAVLSPVPGSPAMAACPVWGCAGDDDPGDPGTTTTTQSKPRRPGNRAAQIVTMGDSFASGEGNPDISKQSGGPVWQSATCHRSANHAPAARAVNRLRTTNPYQDGINFFSAACSGAAINDGMLTPQAGRGVPTQFAQVNSAVGTRQIDILNLSIGGNDLNFAGIVESCMTGWWSCDDSAGATYQNFYAALAQLPGRYDNLITAIQGDGYGNGKQLQAPVTKVMITKYPELMWNAAGEYCDGGWINDPTSGIKSRESNWGTLEVIRKLNAAVDGAVARANARPGAHPQWVAVTPPSFNRHGHCSGDARWVNTYWDSQNVQGDDRGTMHPNYSGTYHLGNGLFDSFKYLNNL